MNVNDIDRDGKSLMFYAVKSNQIDLIKFLFEKKCNINIEDNKGQNCLFPAIQKGNLKWQRKKAKKRLKIRLKKHTL